MKKLRQCSQALKLRGICKLCRCALAGSLVFLGIGFSAASPSEKKKKSENSEGTVDCRLDADGNLSATTGSRGVNY